MADHIQVDLLTAEKEGGSSMTVQNDIGWDLSIFSKAKKKTCVKQDLKYKQEFILKIIWILKCKNDVLRQT